MLTPSFRLCLWHILYSAKACANSQYRDDIWVKSVHNFTSEQQSELQTDAALHRITVNCNWCRWGHRAMARRHTSLCGRCISLFLRAKCQRGIWLAGGRGHRLSGFLLYCCVGSGSDGDPQTYILGGSPTKKRPAQC